MLKQLTEEFNVIDTDGNGMITKDELTNFFVLEKVSVVFDILHPLCLPN